MGLSVFGWHQHRLPDPSPPAATRRVRPRTTPLSAASAALRLPVLVVLHIISIRQTSARPVASQSQPAWERARGRERHRAKTYTHHTRTHATLPLPPSIPSFSTINPPLARLLQSGRPFAAPRSIEPPPTPSRDSPVLSDAAFHCTYPRVPADARTAHCKTPTLAFHQELEPVASGRIIGETAHWRC